MFDVRRSMFDVFDKFASNAEPRNRAPTVRERVYLPAHALDRIRSLTVAALLDAPVAPFTKKFSRGRYTACHGTHGTYEIQDSPFLTAVSLCAQSGFASG